MHQSFNLQESCGVYGCGQRTRFENEWPTKCIGIYCWTKELRVVHTDFGGVELPISLELQCPMQLPCAHHHNNTRCDLQVHTVSQIFVYSHAVSHCTTSFEADDRLFRRLHKQATKDGQIRTQKISSSTSFLEGETSATQHHLSKCSVGAHHQSHVCYS